MLDQHELWYRRESSMIPTQESDMPPYQKRVITPPQIRSITMQAPCPLLGWPMIDFFFFALYPSGIWHEDC